MLQWHLIFHLEVLSLLNYMKYLDFESGSLGLKVGWMLLLPRACATIRMNMVHGLTGIFWYQQPQRGLYVNYHITTDVKLYSVQHLPCKGFNWRVYFRYSGTCSKDHLQFKTACLFKTAPSRPFTVFPCKLYLQFKTTCSMWPLFVGCRGGLK